MERSLADHPKGHPNTSRTITQKDSKIVGHSFTSVNRYLDETPGQEHWNAVARMTEKETGSANAKASL